CRFKYEFIGHMSEFLRFDNPLDQRLMRFHGARSDHSQMKGDRRPVRSLYLDPHVIKPPSFVVDVLSFRSRLSQSAKESQHEEASVVLEGALNFVDAILVFHSYVITERVYCRRASSRACSFCVTTGRRVLSALTCEFLQAPFHIGEGGVNQGNAIFQFESPTIRADDGSIAIPGTCNIEIEYYRDRFVRGELIQSQLDRFVIELPQKSRLAVWSHLRLCVRPCRPQVLIEVIEVFLVNDRCFIRLLRGDEQHDRCAFLGF